MANKSVTQQAIEALQSGKSDLDKEVYGEDTGTSTDEPLETEELADGQDDILNLFSDVNGEENVDDQSTDESTTDGDEPLDNSVLEALDEGKEKPSKETPAEDVEFIKAADKRIKIDYNDRKRIKRAFAAEAGMRKFQRERDEVKKLYEVSQEKASNYDKLNELYQKSGTSGVVEQLEGRTLDEIVQERIDLLILKEENPTKAAQVEYENQLAEERRQRELIQQQMEEVKQQTAAEREAVEEAKLEGMIQPVFNKYSFSGKLGNPDREHIMDQALWNQAFARLEDYPEDTPITPALIRKEFRTVANAFGKIIKDQVKEKTQEASKAKRVAAKENVQSAVASGNVADAGRAEFARKYKSGDMTGSLIDLMTGKVKL